MKKKRKKTDKPGNAAEGPITVSPASFSPRPLANNTFASASKAPAFAKAPAVGVHIACLVVLVLIIYSNTLNAPFQWDEDEFLVNNPIVNNLHYFATPSDAKGFQYYGHLMERYVGYLTFALNRKMHGFSVPGYHIVNIAIHVANTVLVYLLVLLTFRTPFFLINTDSGLSGIDSRSLIAFFSSMLFAVHPVQTEAVTYVFQRFVPLTALFSLISLVAYIKARLSLTTECTEKSFNIKKPKKFFWSAQSSSPSSLWLILSFLSAVLAMKTKEIAFTLPLIITLYEFCFFSPSPRVPVSSRLRYLAPILLTMSIIPLTLIYMKVTMNAGKHDLPGVSYAMLPRGEYMLTQFRVIVTYLRLLFMPVNQNFDYDYPVFKSVLDPQVIVSFLFLSALFGLGVYLVIKQVKVKTESLSAVSQPQPIPLPAFRLIGFGILWFFITLSVESSIVPLDRLIDEYRMYLPSAGISIAVVTGVFLLRGRVQSLKAGKAILVLLVLAAGVLAIAAYNRNGVWGDRIGLWEDTVKKSPGSAEAHYSLGVAYQNLNMPDKAMEQYLITVNLRPDYVEAHNNLGNLYKNFNMPDRAMEQYLIAIKLRPDYAEAHFNLASFLYYRMGQKENARRELIAGLKIKPDDQEAQQLLNELSR